MSAKKSGKSKKSKENIQIKAVIVVVLALISFSSLLFTEQTGYGGVFLKEVLTGLAGEIAWVVPAFLLVIGGVWLVRKNIEISGRLIGFGILLVLVIIGTHMEIVLKSDFLSRGEIIQKNWELLLQRQGGGFIGSLFSTVFLLTVGELGTLIVLAAGGFLAFLLMTNTTFDQLLYYFRTFLLFCWEKLLRAKNGILFLRYILVARGRHKDKKEYSQVYENNDEDKTSFEPEGDREQDVAAGNIIEIEDFKKNYENKAENYQSREEDSEREAGDVPVIDFETAKERSKQDDKAVKDTSLKEDPVNEVDYNDYELPGLELLKHFPRTVTDFNREKDLNNKATVLVNTLESFGVKAKVTRIQKGPTVNRFEVQPAPGVKVSKIVNLSDDIALALAASEVRIEAPIPGKSVVGIEVPNEVVSVVYIRDVLESEKFQKASSPLSLAIGKDITGEPVMEDLAKMPHLLIAGATGSGKSVCINTLITSILYKAKPDDVKFLLIDPKVVELKSFDGLPHLIAPVVTDPKTAASALKNIVKEMESRYRLFANADVKDIKGYNIYAWENDLKELPYIVVIIDELADLMMVAPSEVEDAIFRLAQMSRAAGIHLIVATQRPSVDVITGVIKSNITTRIAFAVTSQTNSRTILDSSGAEKLLGEGDMLYSPVNTNKLIRIQGAFISDKEVSLLVEKIKEQADPEYNEDLVTDAKEEEETRDGGEEEDELLGDAVKLVLESGQASISLIQRRFRIGYTRAARLIDEMERKGIVGGFEGSKPRKILLSDEEKKRYLERDKRIDNNGTSREENEVASNADNTKEEKKNEEQGKNEFQEGDLHPDKERDS